ncbi:MAG: transcriptional regulator [Mycobacterium sp.]|nr:MAG: transcriptional regulator [Mycobacterium sp.]
MHDLIRAGLQLASESGDEWLADITHATAQSLPQVAADPDLAVAMSRAHRANLRRWGSAMMQSPIAPAPPLLDTAENLDLARMLAHRGLTASTPDIFRIAQTVAWRRWTDIAFGLGADPEELREVLNLSMSRLSEFLDAASRYVCAPTHAESHHAGIEHQTNLERRALIESLLYSTATDTDTAVVAGLLGYRLDLPHTAAVIWSDRGDDAAAVEDAAKALIEACAGQSLSVTSGAQSHWVWTHQVECVDPGQIEAAIAPQVYMAIGGPGYGITGFVRSHRDALTAQRIMAQLKCPQRVLHSSTQLQLIGLVTKNRAEAIDFIQRTLGDFASASPSIHASVLAYIEAGCNVTHAAKALFTHRNTVLNRLDTAQRLLPRPLKENLIDVAVALRTLRWMPGTDTVAERLSHNNHGPQRAANSRRA